MKPPLTLRLLILSLGLLSCHQAARAPKVVLDSAQLAHRKCKLLLDSLPLVNRLASSYNTGLREVSGNPLAIAHKPLSIKVDGKTVGITCQGTFVRTGL